MHLEDLVGVAKEGHVKIYLDGKDQPAVDLPFRDYFTGKTAPSIFPSSLITGGSGLPWAESLSSDPLSEVLQDRGRKGWGRYYHFTYTTFPKGTKVPTFKADLSAEDVAALKKLDDFLSERRGQRSGRPWTGQETIR